MSLKHIVLALTREPVSGYTLNQVIQQTIRHFWAADQAQLYRTLRTLEEDGLVTQKQLKPDRGPARKTYTRTAKGRRELILWLESEPEFSAERSAYVAQLVFLHEAADLKTTVRFIERLKERFQSSLATFRKIESGEPQVPLSRMALDDLHGTLGLRLALMTSETRIAWCDWALSILNRRIKTEST